MLTGRIQTELTTPPGVGVLLRTIYRSNDYDAIGLRTTDHNTILFIIDNLAGASDTSHNGLWEIHADGTGLKRLITTNPEQYSYWNYRSQEPWSNISRDNSLYVLQVNQFVGLVEKHSLYVGSLLDGSAKVFATIADGSQLGMVGWTII